MFLEVDFLLNKKPPVQLVLLRASKHFRLRMLPLHRRCDEDRLVAVDHVVEVVLGDQGIEDLGGRGKVADREVALGVLLGVESDQHPGRIECVLLVEEDARRFGEMVRRGLEVPLGKEVERCIDDGEGCRGHCLGQGREGNVIRDTLATHAEGLHRRHIGGPGAEQVELPGRRVHVRLNLKPLGGAAVVEVEDERCGVVRLHDDLGGSRGGRHELNLEAR